MKHFLNNSWSLNLNNKMNLSSSVKLIHNFILVSLNKTQIILALSLVLMLLVSIGTHAQKKDFTMAEAINGMSSKFAIKNLKQLQWMGSSDFYSYVVNTDSEKVVYQVNPINFDTKPYTNLDKLNNGLDAVGIKKLSNIPTINFKSQSSFYFTHDNKIIECNSVAGNLAMNKIATLPENAEDIIIDTNKMSVAYTSNDNLYVIYKEGNPIKITKDGTPNLVYGKSVHRNEFGIDKGIFWSPVGNFIAFYKMDQSMVEDYPIVNWNDVPATVKNIKYPFAGRTSHEVKVGVFDCSNGKTIYLNTGEPNDQYLTNISWSPDEQFIYVSIVNRDQNYLKLNKYNAITGQLIKTVLEERNEKYVEPQHLLYFPTSNPNQFVWWSQKDGFMHLYLYTNDLEEKQLTVGNWIVNEVLGFNKKTQEIVFTSSKESPMQKNVYAVNIATKAIRTISTIFGTHIAQLSQSGTYIIDNFSNRETPRAIEVTNIVSKLEKRILTSANTLLDYNTARVEQINLTTSDGTTLYGKLIYPKDFDSTKKYPTIVYLYNGPHVQLNKETFPFSGNLWYDYMAQHGYVMFILDGRGSSNRGFEFESVIHRKLGTLEMEDQLLGVNYLKSLPFVDANRMGVHGWSYGGFMTTSFMLRNPGVFKVGVAGGPVLDLSMYEIMYGERYMDTPQQNPEGYKTNLLLDKVKNLQGKLMLIHGTDDDVVVWQHSLKFIKNCVSEGIPIDYFVYPGHPHNVRGKDRVHLMQKITDYFDTYLK